MAAKKIEFRKTLYSSPGFRYGDDAQALATKAHAAVAELLREYFVLGYNPREISQVIEQEVHTAGLSILLRMKREDDNGSSD